MTLEKIKEDANSIQDLLSKRNDKNKKEIDLEIKKLLKSINNSVEEEKNVR